MCIEFTQKIKLFPNLSLCHKLSRAQLTLADLSRAILMGDILSVVNSTGAIISGAIVSNKKINAP